jgi:hypothetical protein
MPPDLLTCSPLLSHEEAAAALHVTVAEIGKLLASGHLMGNSWSIRTTSIRAFIDYQQRKLIEPPPKVVTVVVWPGPVSYE